MKLSHLFFSLLIFFSFVSLNAQKEGQEWKKGEFEEMVATYPKLYVFPDGRYLITKKLPKKMAKVALTMLFFSQDIGKVKMEGRLSEKFVRKYLKGIEPFNPVPVMTRPPCCHYYDKDGNHIGSFYPPNGCPDDCKKPLLKNGVTAQFNCCLPSDMSYQIMAGIRPQ